MRGNELHVVMPDEVWDEFPIPMRGNELKDESWDGLLKLAGSRSP